MRYRTVLKGQNVRQMCDKILIKCSVCVVVLGLGILFGIPFIICIIIILYVNLSILGLMSRSLISMSKQRNMRTVDTSFSRHSPPGTNIGAILKYSSAPIVRLCSPPFTSVISWSLSGVVWKGWHHKRLSYINYGKMQ